jgi:uncharacterized protein YggE
MKKLLCLVVVLALSLVSCAAFAETADAVPQQLMTVQGNAVVTVEADTVSIQLGVRTKHASLSVAQKENRQLMDSVLTALKECGVQDKEMMTQNLNIYNSYDYDSSDGADRQVYYVENCITLTLTDISRVGDILDAAVDAGANNMYGITFTSSKSNEAYLKALARAVEDAQAKAEVLATAAGVSLDRLVEIQAAPNYSAYSVDSYAVRNTVVAQAKDFDAGTSVMGGDLSVSATVTLIYAYK